MPRVRIAIAVTLFAALTTLVALQAPTLSGLLGGLTRNQLIVIIMIAAVFSAWLSRRLSAKRARRATARRCDADRDQVRSVYLHYARHAPTGQLHFDLDRWGRELCYTELRGPVERTRELTEIVRIYRAELERRSVPADSAVAVRPARERIAFESDRPLTEPLR